MADLTSDVLLTAAAGTGKTHALVGRYLSALGDPREAGGPPATRVPTLVAITFTTAAAAEMRKRVEAAVRQTARQFPPKSEARQTWNRVLDVLHAARISTIHAFCASLLRELPLSARDIAGVVPGFDVLDATEANALREEAFRRTLVRLQSERGALWQSYVALAAERGVADVAEMVRILEEHRFATTPKALMSEAGSGTAPNGPGGGQPATSGAPLETLGKLWEAVQESYRRAKQERGGLDFDDLEEAALALTGDPSTLAELRGGIRHLLVDEFQDVSKRQLELLLRLRGSDPPIRRALFAVGDPKQSIYAFRGARGALEGLRGAMPGLREGRLDRTRRFRDPLATFVNRLSSVLLPAEAIGGRYEPILPAETATGGAGSSTHVDVVWLEGPLRATPTAGRDEVRKALQQRFLDPSLPGPVPADEGLEHAEARFIAGWVVDRLAAGETVRPWRPDDGDLPHRLGPGDVALLLSYRSHEEEYVAALRERGLKVVTHPGAGFHGRSEVQDVMNLLAVLAWEGDEASLYALLRSPFFAFSDEEMAEWFLAAESSGSLSEAFRHRAAASPGSREARSLQLIEGWRARRERTPPAELLRDALDDVGAWGTFADDGRGGRARANVEKLLDTIRELPRSGVVGLAAVHRYLLELQEREADEPEAGVELARDAVNIMTVHGAKGLEFPLVVVPGLQRQWSAPRGALLVSPTGKVAIEAGPEEEGKEVGSGAPEEGEPAAKAPTGANGAQAGPGGAATYEEVVAALAHDAELEARRLLYVAVTRARDRLLLTCVQRRSAAGAPLSFSREPWRRWLDEAFGFDATVEREIASTEGWRFRRLPSAAAETAPLSKDATPLPLPKWVEAADAPGGEAALPSEGGTGTLPFAEILEPGKLLRDHRRVPFTVTELDLLRQCEARWWAWRNGAEDPRAGPRPDDLEEQLTPLGGSEEGEDADGDARGGADSAEERKRLGISLHTVLAQGPPWDDPRLPDLVDRALPRSIADRERRVGELTEAARWALRQDLSTPDGPPLREEPLALIVGDAVVWGRPDAVFLSPATSLVEDYKGGPTRAPSPEVLRTQHGFQLGCYALSIRRGRRPVHVRVVLPRAKGMLAWELTPLDLDAQSEELQHLVRRAISILDHEASPTPCGRDDCPHCLARTAAVPVAPPSTPAPLSSDPGA